MPEQYVNLFSTTVGGGGYTAGSGVLNVASTTGVTLNAGDTCRLLVYSVSGGVITPVVLLKATAVNSGTQFAVTAEGSDTSASSGNNVIMVLSAGAMNQIRADAFQADTRANLPSTTGQTTGNRFKCTDSPYDFRFNGSIWVPFLDGLQVTEPLSTGWTWLNQGTSTVSSTYGGVILDAAQNSPLEVRGRYQAQPSIPFRIYAAFKMSFFGTNYQAGGLFFLDTVSGKLKVFTINGQTIGSSAAPFIINIAHMSGAANPGTNTNLLTRAIMPQGTIWLSIEDDGTNHNFYWSADGVNWILFYSETDTTYVTPTSVGFCGYADSSNVSDALIWLLHWLT